LRCRRLCLRRDHRRQWRLVLRTIGRVCKPYTFRTLYMRWARRLIDASSHQLTGECTMKSAAMMVVGLTAAAFALPAAAQMTNDSSAFYVGGSVGQSKIKDCT